MVPKYRAWDKEEKEWLSIRTIGFDDDGSLVKWELLQSTGLKDKNGVEIYEGDVVKTKYGEHGRHIGVVKYGGAKFYSEGVKQYLSWHEDLNGLFEIIGNRYEHPHLLEGDTE